jgi:hypothetical protein
LNSFAEIYQEIFSSLVVQPDHLLGDFIDLRFKTVACYFPLILFRFSFLYNIFEFLPSPQPFLIKQFPIVSFVPFFVALGAACHLFWYKRIGELIVFSSNS